MRARKVFISSVWAASSHFAEAFRIQSVSRQAHHHRRRDCFMIQLIELKDVLVVFVSLTCATAINLNLRFLIRLLLLLIQQKFIVNLLILISPLPYLLRTEQQIGASQHRICNKMWIFLN